MNEVNELVICNEDYYSQEEFENAIKTAVMLLLGANYTMTIRYDDKGLGIVVINYNPADQTWGAKYPYWLSPDEAQKAFCAD